MTKFFGNPISQRSAATWLAILIVLSVSIRFLIALRYPALWIIDDEVINVELARALAGAPENQVRGVGGASFYFLYAALIAPAFALFDDPSTSYLAIKFINCSVMSSVAFPVYLLARRVLEREFALLVVLMSLAVPSMVYTASVMTENAFYPAFLWCALAMTRSLERPTILRQLIALFAIAVTCLIRNQAIALLPALVLALFSQALFDSKGKDEASGRTSGDSLVKRLSAYRLTWMILAAPLLMLVMAWLVDAEAIEVLAGQNQFIFGMSDETVAGFLPRLPRTFFGHLANLDLYVGVLPFIAMLALAINVFRNRTEDAALKRFTWVALWATLCNVLMVAAFLAFVGQTRVADRNLFFVAPFFFIAFCRWTVGFKCRQSWILIACLVAGALPILVELSYVDRTKNFADGLVLVAVSKVQFLLGFADAFQWLLVAAALAVSFAMFLPRRFLRLTPWAVVLFLCVISVPVVRATRTASLVARNNGTMEGSTHWIDDSVEAGVRVDAIWHGAGSKHSYWQGTFFNRSVSQIFGFLGCEHDRAILGGNRDQSLDRLSMNHLVIDERTGLLLNEAFEPIEFDHVLTNAKLELKAKQVRKDVNQDMVLYDVDGQVAVVSRTVGVAANGWTEPEFSYTIYNAPAGMLAVELNFHKAAESEAGEDRRTLVARIDDSEMTRVVFDSGEFKTILIPYPESYESCARIDFEVLSSGGAIKGDSRIVPGSLICRSLKRLDQSTDIELLVSGAYPDGWAFPQFDLLVDERVPGKLALSLWSGENSGLESQRLMGSIENREVINELLVPGTQFWCELPIHAESNSISVLQFNVEPPFRPDGDVGSRSLGLFPGTFVFVSPSDIDSELTAVHHDFWTEPEFRYSIPSDLAGVVSVYVASNDKLFEDGQTITARIGDREVVSALIEPGEERTISFDVAGIAAGQTQIEFDVSPSLDQVRSTRTVDPRDLGMLLRGISFVADEATDH